MMMMIMMMMMMMMMIMMMMMMMIYVIDHVTGILVESLSFVRRLVKIYVKGNLSIRIIVYTRHYPFSDFDVRHLLSINI